jgi:hypothetical protein
LSNIRMVFVANKPAGNFTAFDMPLVCNTYYHICAPFLPSFYCHVSTFCSFFLS